MTDTGFIKFLQAQNQMYLKALSEIRHGRKESHWMWFIFPQITGLGFSETSRFYSISSLPEAEDYLAHPVLGKHLIEISEALLHIEGKTATEILGAPDDIKLCSSMTLFSKAKNTNPVFQAVLAKYFMNATDESTEKALEALASNT